MWGKACPPYIYAALRVSAAADLEPSFSGMKNSQQSTWGLEQRIVAVQHRISGAVTSVWLVPGLF